MKVAYLTLFLVFGLAAAKPYEPLDDVLDNLDWDDQGPSFEDPATDEPKTAAPEPETNEPGTENPGTDKPATDKPGTDKPGTDKPGTDKSGTELPSPTESHPTGSRPTGSHPTGSHPTGSRPTGSQPTGWWPTGSHPTGSRPTGSQPTGWWPTGSHPTGSHPTGSRPTGSQPTRWWPTGSHPTGSRPTGWRPTGSHPTGSRPTGSHPTGSRPTNKPIKNFWEKFAHFLFVKSVQGVKPDEHPDCKYKMPLEDLVRRLLDVKRAVVKALKPIVQIGKLAHQDHEEMGRRVYKATMNNDIEKAKHISGEYLIALQRRFAMFIVQATHAGLFNDIDHEMKETNNLMGEYKKHSHKPYEVAKFILENFNEFRVSDGFPDAPFVKLGVQTAKVFRMAGMQGAKVGKVAFQSYTTLISKLLWLSLEKNDHDAAVRAAGASLLSFTRRGTKVGMALHRMYGPKKCYGPKPNKGH